VLAHAKIKEIQMGRKTIPSTSAELLGANGAQSASHSPTNPPQPVLAIPPKADVQLEDEGQADRAFDAAFTKVMPRPQETERAAFEAATRLLFKRYSLFIPPELRLGSALENPSMVTSTELFRIVRTGPVAVDQRQNGQAGSRASSCRIQPAANGRGPGAAIGVQDAWDFVRDGNEWRLAFGDEQGRFPHQRGFAYYGHLLSKPNAFFSALDLVRIECGTVRPGRSLVGEDELRYENDSNGRNFSARGQTRWSRYETLDKQALAECERRIKEIDEEIAEATAHHDDARSEKLWEERGRISAELNAASAPRDRIKCFTGGDHVEKARSSVGQALKRARRALEFGASPMCKLAVYLKNHVKGTAAGYGFYPRQGDKRWECSSNRGANVTS
jgi:hypothetical protein